MKRIIKNPIFTFILGTLIFGGIVGVSAYTIFANDIGYTPKDSTWKVDNVKDAIDELYNKANTSKTVCMLLSGTKNTIGSKYACNPGDGVIRNFYLLKVDGNKVKLIGEQNISDTVGSPRMSQTIALNYLKSGGAGYTTISAWSNVIDVDLPSAQDIANAGGITGWNVTTASANDWSYFGANGHTDSDKENMHIYSWLYNYTRGCVSYANCPNEYAEKDSSKAYGYWTKDLAYNDSNSAWRVTRSGSLGVEPASDGTYNGVRPVITVLKSQLN